MPQFSSAWIMPLPGYAGVGTAAGSASEIDAHVGLRIRSSAEQASGRLDFADDGDRFEFDSRRAAPAGERINPEDLIWPVHAATGLPIVPITFALATSAPAAADRVDEDWFDFGDAAGAAAANPGTGGSKAPPNPIFIISAASFSTDNSDRFDFSDCARASGAEDFVGRANRADDDFGIEWAATAAGSLAAGLQLTAADFMVI
jgi:hypothetical protein